MSSLPSVMQERQVQQIRHSKKDLSMWKEWYTIALWRSTKEIIPLKKKKLCCPPKDSSRIALRYPEMKTRDQKQMIEEHYLSVMVLVDGESRERTKVENRIILLFHKT